MNVLSSKAKTLLFIIRPEDLLAKSERADRLISRLEGSPSRSQLKALMDKGLVTRGSEALEPSTPLRVGDRITCRIEEEAPSSVVAVSMDLKIFYEDEDLLVVYKPRGLSVHPGAGAPTATLVQGLLGRGLTLSDGGLSAASPRSREAARQRPGIVHRLDKDTEGILVVAKTNEIHEKLSRQFRDHSIDRRYWALVWGRFPKSMTIHARLARHRYHRKKMAVLTALESGRGKESITHARALKVFDEFSWIECELETGRTHQIRVHLSFKGFPVVGDLLYGRTRTTQNGKLNHYLTSIKGQALVAYRLGFIHPRSGKVLSFEAEAPEWLRELTAV